MASGARFGSRHVTDVPPGNLEGAWKIFAFVGPDELALARSTDSLESELPVDSTPLRRRSLSRLLVGRIAAYRASIV